MTFLGYIKNNRQKAILSMLGVAIGVFAVVVTSGVSGAMRETTLSELGKMGSETIVVTNGELKKFGNRQAQSDTFNTMKIDDAKFVLEKSKSIKDISIYKDLSAPVRSQKLSATIPIKGVQNNYIDFTNTELSCGRFVANTMEQIAVIGSTTALEMDIKCNDTIYIFGKVPYKVIGILETKGQDEFDKKIFIPLKTAQTRLLNVDFVDGFFVLPHNIESAKKEIDEILYQLHKKRDFSIIGYEELLSTSKQTNSIFSKLSLITASIAFSVGILGIIAIMTLSIYERMVEIGIKRAFGASKRDIFIQFLTEATLLSIAGAIFGVALSLVFIIVIEFVAGFSYFIPYTSIFVSLIISIIIGMISGVYPAQKALSFEPKDILSRD
jgi:putative ABC transport system permease protein